MSGGSKLATVTATIVSTEVLPLVSCMRTASEAICTLGADESTIRMVLGALVGPGGFPRFRAGRSGPGPAQLN